MLFYVAFEGKSVIQVRIVDQENRPVANTPINITKTSGNISGNCDKNGSYIFKDTVNESVTISISNQVIDFYGTITVTAPSNGVKSVVLKGEYKDFLLLTSSRSVMISPCCKRLSFTICGGGGGGGGISDTNYYSAGGGGGGYWHEVTNATFEPYTVYAIGVGSGGSGADPDYGNGPNTYRPNGTDGGSTSGGGKGIGFRHGLTSEGSTTPGGHGNGRGGDGFYFKSTEGSSFSSKSGNPGGEGNGYIYTSLTEQRPCGGGGGGGARANRSDNINNYPGGLGGTPNGANGGRSQADGVSSYNYGGGGGGGGNGQASYDVLNGGSGGSGACGIRMWHSLV